MTIPPPLCPVAFLSHAVNLIQLKSILLEEIKLKYYEMEMSLQAYFSSMVSVMWGSIFSFR